MTPDEHAAKAEALLAEAKETASGNAEDVANILRTAQVHAILAIRQPQIPALPDGSPTEADLRNALLRLKLTTERDDRNAAEWVLIHLVACIDEGDRREEWIKRGAKNVLDTEARFRRAVEKLRYPKEIE